VFFMQTTAGGALKLWVGKQNRYDALQSILQANIQPGHPVNVHIAGISRDFRVADTRMENGDLIYLGLSSSQEDHTLDKLRLYFFLICIGIVLLGFLIIFFTTRRMLGHVQRITDTAARIGHDDLRSRVPEVKGEDEVARLATTLNRMLDRVESTVRQLHTMTDALAHDLRSPITAIRGRLETALLRTEDDGWVEPVASAIEDLDRLCEALTKSLDVAEASASALRLHKEPVDLGELLETMAHLYEPSMAERGLRLVLRNVSPVVISADPGLLQRMIMNLFDNEIKHLPPGCSVRVQLRRDEETGWMVLEDDGPGFPPEVEKRIFEKYAKGPRSEGSGLGLAFVEAVVRAHQGVIQAMNLPSGGIHIEIGLHLTPASRQNQSAAAGRI